MVKTVSRSHCVCGWKAGETGHASSCLDSSDEAFTLPINQSINSTSNRLFIRYPTVNRPLIHAANWPHTPLIQWLTCAGADQYSPQWRHCTSWQAQRPGSVCAVYFQGGRVVRGPNLSPESFLLHLAHQRKEKTTGGQLGGGHTEPISNKFILETTTCQSTPTGKGDTKTRFSAISTGIIKT